MADPYSFTGLLEQFEVTKGDLEPWIERLPFHLQPHAADWIPVYVFWLYRLSFRARFGDKLLKRASQFSRLTPDGATDELEAWFRVLDDAAGEALQPVQAPRETFAARSFLAKDPHSPHYDSFTIPESELFMFGEILGEIREAAYPAIEDFVKSLGPRRH